MWKSGKSIRLNSQISIQLWDTFINDDDDDDVVMMMMTTTTMMMMMMMMMWTLIGFEKVLRNI
jgi:hypothetical protein